MNAKTEEEFTIDSAMNLQESLEGLEIPEEIRDTLALVDVQYYSFDDKLHQGQIVIHQDLANDLRSIFKEILEMRFPIQQVVPIVAYDWDDLVSMGDYNNTSAFNYRFIYGTTELSNHSHGRALDINPRTNPYTTRLGTIIPEGAVYDPSRPGTITADSEIVKIFLSYGWEWGGNWEETRRDWQHFQKLA
jgi:peptidoglycan L-alanyl-D-glutamate endopeptidase CwlK